MGNQAFTIALVSFCGLFYILAFFQIPSKRFNLALAIIMLCGLALRIYMALDFQLYEWDESYHALVAKNMMDNPLHPNLYANPLWVQEMRAMGEELPHQEKTVIFNVERPIDLMFYTECIAYSFEVNDEIRTKLLRQGYVVYDNFFDAFQKLNK